MPCILAVVLGVRGLKKGASYGLRVLATAAAASAAVFFLSPVLSGLALRTNNALHVRYLALDALTEAGLFNLTLARVLSMTLAKLADAFLLPPLLFTLFIFFCLCRVIAAAILTKNKGEKPTLPGWSKLAGLALGLSAAACLGGASLLLPEVTLVGEARRIQTAADIVSPLFNHAAEPADLAERLPELADIYFETALIAADEPTRAALFSGLMRAAFTDINARYGVDIGSAPYASRKDVEGDARAASKFIVFAKTHSMLEPLMNTDQDAMIDAVYACQDRDGFTARLYEFSFSGEVVSVTLTEILRSISGDAEYTYPPEYAAQLPETVFKEALNSFLDIKDISQKNKVTAMKPADRKTALSALGALRDSPVCPPDVFRKIAYQIK